MDIKSLASSKSTPFSINDILTKNNTEIFRRCGSSDSISALPRKSCSENRDCDHMDEATDELSHHLANQMRFFKYSAAHYSHNIGLDQFNTTNDEFPYNNNSSTVNNNHGKMAFANDVNARQGASADKSIKSMRFYNFPLVMERPLDMRRCNNDDESGKNMLILN